MAESSDNTLFRTPIPQGTPSVKEFAPEKPAETTTDSDFEPAPSEKVLAGWQPEICKLLEMGDTYKQFEMESLTNEIDAFINAQIKAQGLKDDKKAYVKVFENILEKSNPPRDNIYTMIERMNEYVKLQNKLIQIAKEKEEFEKKPIDEMSSKQMERYLRENGTTRY